MQAIGCRRTRRCLGWRASARRSTPKRADGCSAPGARRRTSTSATVASRSTSSGSLDTSRARRRRSCASPRRSRRCPAWRPRSKRARSAGAPRASSREWRSPRRSQPGSTPLAARPSASSRRSWRAERLETPPTRRRSPRRAGRAALRGGCGHVRDVPRSDATAAALCGRQPGRRRPLARDGPSHPRRASRRRAQQLSGRSQRVQRLRRRRAAGGRRARAGRRSGRCHGRVRRAAPRRARPPRPYPGSK